jgi:hypothetical protein
MTQWPLKCADIFLIDEYHVDVFLDLFAGTLSCCYRLLNDVALLLFSVLAATIG